MSQYFTPFPIMVIFSQGWFLQSLVFLLSFYRTVGCMSCLVCLFFWVHGFFVLTPNADIPHSMLEKENNVHFFLDE